MRPYPIKRQGATTSWVRGAQAMSKSLSTHPYAGKKRFHNAEVAPADHGAGQVRKAAWMTRSRSQPILSGRKLQPGEGALDDPAPAAQPRAVLGAAAGDDRF